jgi:hypothetical protein
MLNVYEILLGGRHPRIVAAESSTEAAQLLGVTDDFMSLAGRIVDDPVKVKAATNSKGRVLKLRKITVDDWELV